MSDPIEPQSSSDLAEATAQLRAVPLPRVVEIADAVLQRSLRTPRLAVLVRARPPADHLQVSSTVITTVLRARIDSQLRKAAVGRVALEVGRDGQLGELTVELFVQFGTDIPEVGEQTRALVAAALVELLGPPTGPPVTVTVSHVHVSDVTVGDPHLVDPADE